MPVVVRGRPPLSGQQPTVAWLGSLGVLPAPGSALEFGEYDLLPFEARWYLLTALARLEWARTAPAVHRLLRDNLGAGT